MITISLSGLTASAQEMTPLTEQEVSSGKLDSVLVDILSSTKLEESKKIPVAIEFDDNYNADSIEKAAYKKANIDPVKLREKEESIDHRLAELEKSGLSSIEIEQANEAYQKDLLVERDRLTKARNILIAEHVENATESFIKEADIDPENIESVCTLIPFIQLVWLTPAEIQELNNNPSVFHIEYVDINQKFQTYATNARTIIGGDTFINAGYTGSNIRVGVIDGGHPRLGTASNSMGTDGSSVTLTNSGTAIDHSTMVCGIIKKMAPGAQIFSRAITYVSDVLPAAEWLITNSNVHVINLSGGILSSTGEFNTYSRGIDQLIYRTRRTICIAAGNPENSSQTIYNMYVNQFGLAPNAITVGAVTRSGTNPAATGAYTAAYYSMYRQANSAINKPDICAPGNVSIYSFTGKQGTSFSTPLITGTVVQMMSRNSGLTDKPETLKAALMASASYNGGTSMSYVTNSIGSDREGAGVVDATFCYNVARNGRRTHFDATEGTNTYSVSAYCDYNDRPFRVAISWYVNSTSSSTQKTDFELEIYKDGEFITSSRAWANSTTNPNTNYEIISIPAQTYGAGYYEVRVYLSGTFAGPSPNRIGVAWEQRR